jgi:hypothetical protein
MALGTLAENPDCGLKIVPCGMNYFHAHKFRSRAVIEFGTPIDVPRELVEQFKQGERRESVGALLDIIYGSLVSVTVTSPDYETLMVGFLLFQTRHFSSQIIGYPSGPSSVQHQGQKASSSHGCGAEPSPCERIRSLQG